MGYKHIFRVDSGHPVNYIDVHFKRCPAIICMCNSKKYSLRLTKRPNIHLLHDDKRNDLV